MQRSRNPLVDRAEAEGWLSMVALRPPHATTPRIVESDGIEQILRESRGRLRPCIDLMRARGIVLAPFSAYTESPAMQEVLDRIVDGSGAMAGRRAVFIGVGPLSVVRLRLQEPPISTRHFWGYIGLGEGGIVWMPTGRPVVASADWQAAATTLTELIQTIPVGEVR